MGGAFFVYRLDRLTFKAFNVEYKYRLGFWLYFVFCIEYRRYCILVEKLGYDLKPCKGGIAIGFANCYKQLRQQYADKDYGSGCSWAEFKDG